MTDDCRQFPLSGHAFFGGSCMFCCFLCDLQVGWGVPMSSRCVCCGSQ